VKRKGNLMFEKRVKGILLFLFCLSVPAAALDYDANDFASEFIEYVPGSGIITDIFTGEAFDEPEVALGRPTLETTGDGTSINPAEAVPLVPVYPAFRAFEVVTVGNGGHLTLKFNHRVSDDEKNLYGIDFIIFGNAKQTSVQPWTNGNPEDVTVSGSIFSEPGIVSVSQTGDVNDWYYFPSGPYADTFAPTAAYEWDDVNDCWAEELDPTRPTDPNLSASAMGGKTVAEMIALYVGSAGGTGFDLEDLEPNDYAALAVDPNTGRKWIQCVRIEDNPDSPIETTEIDAVADVSCCGDYKHPYPLGDLNKDCRVDFADYALLTSNWLKCTWNCP
jgi:hypothetical protein